PELLSPSSPYWDSMRTWQPQESAPYLRVFLTGRLLVIHPDTGDLNPSGPDPDDSSLQVGPLVFRSKLLQYRNLSPGRKEAKGFGDPRCLPQLVRGVCVSPCTFSAK